MKPMVLVLDLTPLLLMISITVEKKVKSYIHTQHLVEISNGTTH